MSINSNPHSALARLLSLWWKWLLKSKHGTCVFQHRSIWPLSQNAEPISICTAQVCIHTHPYTHPTHTHTHRGYTHPLQCVFDRWDWQVWERRLIAVQQWFPPRQQPDQRLREVAMERRKLRKRGEILRTFLLKLVLVCTEWLNMMQRLYFQYNRGVREREREREREPLACHLFWLLAVNIQIPLTKKPKLLTFSFYWVSFMNCGGLRHWRQGDGSMTTVHFRSNGIHGMALRN